MFTLFPKEIWYQIVPFLENGDIGSLLLYATKYSESCVSTACLFELSKRGCIQSNSLCRSLPFHLLENLPTLNASNYIFQVLRFNAEFGTKIVPQEIQLTISYDTISSFIDFFNKVENDLLRSSSFIIRINLEEYPCDFADSLLKKLTIISKRINKLTIVGNDIRPRLLEKHNLKLSYFGTKTRIESFHRSSKLISLNRLPSNVIHCHVENSKLSTLLSQTYPLLQSVVFDNISEDFSLFLNMHAYSLKHVLIRAFSFPINKIQFAVFPKLQTLKICTLQKTERRYRPNLSAMHRVITAPISDLLYQINSTTYRYINTHYYKLSQLPFSQLEFPESLLELHLEGGMGPFDCSRFDCPKRLRKLALKSQVFRKESKLILPQSLISVDFSESHIPNILQIKFPDSIEFLDISNKVLIKFSPHWKFPTNIKFLNITTPYPLVGEFDFRKYNKLQVLKVFLDYQHNSIRVNDFVEVSS
ncbi:uncharacterized protein CANTADRAFT_26833 [Suhomyces tanzawaensis NRRL Y-17324]|uniref:F-box domain-containing protein n=1 Tax=Suhomyces tanzawaensis NRRL Y-17324 TaxID=984487 RepID=A0A1E4SE20_9ASCO|nr:uncharacterized protein CANTADRAFT_26833 [Suhomyces tanzawaensis NRRL Y-17324]ODV77769.1 hypothetical protein CANTADRAFT_26833 [Suhomyces tanzawaensis NRRL Y-17324]